MVPLPPPVRRPPAPRARGDRAETLCPVLHRRASAWYRDAGLIVDAAGHAIAGGDLDAVAELVGRHYGLFVDQGQLTTVMGWLEAMPEQAAAEDWLLGLRRRRRLRARRPVRRGRALARARRGAPQVARERPGARRPAGRARGLPAAASGRHRRDRSRNARRALATAPAADPIVGARAADGARPRALVGGQAGRGEGASSRRSTRTAQAAGIPAATVYALGNRAAIALDEQDEHAAEALATRGDRS